MTKHMPCITPMDHHNYVAFFLTFSCNLDCPYCINLHGRSSRPGRPKQGSMSVDDWILATRRLILRDDLPLTLQGGEPTLYKGFYRLTNEANEAIKMDLMTNMMFDVKEFIRNVPVWRFARKAPYAAIRVSYHPEQNNIDELIAKTKMMQDAGFRVGLYGIDYPDDRRRNHIHDVQETCLKLGLDFRTKEFLGEYGGKLYGTFKYEKSVCSDELRHCQCKTTEILVDPAGYVYRCHADIYNGRAPIAHILDEDFNEESLERFRDCRFYGGCNPCDVKVKTNRYQVFGHTSVEVRNIR
jgi:organic radical activating enzyme